MGDDGHDSDLELPIKLGGCSNGEYVPPPLTQIEAETIRRTQDAAEPRPGGSASAGGFPTLVCGRRGHAPDL